MVNPPTTATLLLGLSKGMSREHVRRQVNLAALYLGLFPSAVSYYFWSKAITLAKRTSEATNYLFINPLIASVIALIMLREIPGAGTFLGGIIIVASVIVFSTRGGK